MNFQCVREGHKNISPRKIPQAGIRVGVAKMSPKAKSV